eukprot:scaffold223669_cov21-Tisochrysis_lutea.AAC.2
MRLSLEVSGGACCRGGTQQHHPAVPFVCHFGSRIVVLVEHLVLVAALCVYSVVMDDLRQSWQNCCMLELLKRPPRRTAAAAT